MHSILVMLALIGTGPAGREAVRADSQSVVLELHPAAAQYRGATEIFVTLSESSRRIAIDCAGPEPTRVELLDREGRVGLTWGERPAGTLLLEGARDIAAGQVRIRVAFTCAWADSGGGLVRTGRGARADVVARLSSSGASRAFPCMLGVGPQRWAFTLEVPTTHEVRSNLRRLRSGRAPGVRTTVFRSRTASPVDSVRFEIRPRTRR